ncbi:SPFH domain-containing protein [Hymenobacter rubripertinctus]|uniref:SPFH domain-containing protein n=1 Tax=Hymenobacter rubripertinctus TaxID=2029981 RepID=UPI001FEBDF0E|nr:SPFH domain-containing protein [Hymenobacter rubripertinctus]
MFGINHSQFDSMTYVIHYKNGRVQKEGRGLSFYYFGPNSSIVAIPMGSNDLPFIFNETTANYQTVSIQGQITYKAGDPRQLADQLDFTVDSRGIYKKNELEKLHQRIINEAQTATSTFVQSLGLKDVMRSAKAVELNIAEGLAASKAIGLLGIEVLAVNVLAVKATPEMGRALETETREKIQQEADQAIFERRNFAVEQERKIKESELNTDIAVEEKNKQIAEKKMEGEMQRATSTRKLREMQVQADIAVEEQRKLLLEQTTANQRQEAETRGYVLETTLQPYKNMDWKLLVALNNNPDPKFNIALAFRELAENAGKIGNLNISPDLLDSLLTSPPARSERPDNRSDDRPDFPVDSRPPNRSGNRR